MMDVVEIKKDGEEFPVQVKVEGADLPVEEVVPVALNRHERRKRAKLARVIAMKEHMEMKAKSSKLIAHRKRKDEN